MSTDQPRSKCETLPHFEHASVAGSLCLPTKPRLQHFGQRTTTSGMPPLCRAAMQASNKKRRHPTLSDDL
jgi:hypothetical protein